MTIRLIAALAATVSASLGASPDLLEFVPPKARLVAGANAARLGASPLARLWLSGVPPEISRRATEVMIVSSGAGPEPLLAVLSGNFQGVRPGPHSRLLPGDSVILHGPDDWIQAAIEQRGAHGKRAWLTAAPGLRASRDAWVVSDLPISELADGVADRNVRGALKGDAFKSIRSWSGGLLFSRRTRVSAEADAASTKDAGTLAQAAQFLFTFFQLNPPGDSPARLLTSINDFEVKSVSNRFQINFSLSQAQVEQLLDVFSNPHRMTVLVQKP